VVLAVDEEAFGLEPRPLLARLAEGLPLLRGAREGEGSARWSWKEGWGSGGRSWCGAGKPRSPPPGP